MNQNKSAANVTYREFSSLQWITCELTSCIFSVACFYVLICLLIYEIRMRTQSVDRGVATVSGDNSIVQQAVRSDRRKAKKTRRNQKWLRYFTILCTLCAVLKVLVNQIDLFWGTKSSIACTLFSITAICGYGGSLFFIYIILWLRQYIVQSHSALRHLPHRNIRVYGGRVLLGVMLILFGSLFLLNFVTIKVKPSPGGCVFADSGEVSQSVRSLAGLIFTIVFQPAFAVLLLYPLLKKLPSHRRPKLTSASMRSAHPGVKKCNSVEHVKSLIRRTLIAIALVTVSDIGAIVATFLLEKQPIIFVALAYDANAFVGIVSAIYSFSDWRQRFLGKKTPNADIEKSV
ncbi:uncharacterized protein LOC101242726 [Ciona intestinalis]